MVWPVGGVAGGAVRPPERPPQMAKAPAESSSAGALRALRGYVLLGRDRWRSHRLPGVEG